MAISPAPIRSRHPWPMHQDPDPEVAERPARRHFSAAYKAAILDELERATEPGARGALLRREGLYSSHVTDWRRLRAAGGLDALGRPRGPPTRWWPRTHACAGRWDGSRRGSSGPRG